MLTKHLLLQASTDGTIPEGERDDFWTLVTYFNSLRELGGSLVLMQDDTPKSIDLYAGRRGEGPRVTAPPLELTSRVSQTEIKDILETLETACGSPGCCDILLSSNMISVGVDVPRLGMMIVNGQPKGIAEYIQATSRVGRRFDGPGGLVVTTYNNAKARDRSHFETFATWHAALYREVEATSVTPFAARARQKALHATIVVLARHLVSGLRAEPGAIRHHDAVVREFADNIADRAKSVDQSEVVAVEDALHDFIENWAIHADGMRFYWSDYRDGESLLISAERAAEIQSKRGTYTGRARPTPNSMRNVEASTLFRLKEGL